MADRRKEEMESRLSLYLHTAAELVTQVGTILDPEAFLSAAVTLLKERFGLYHVHVYTLDEKAGDLVMRAGYGEAGRVMKEQGHKIPLSSERSLVAQAARTREIVTVGDVTQDPDFLPNPLLPDTKSEMAIPLTIGEQVLGVFDIQDDALDRFSSVEVDVFRTLSGQLAVTLQNAQLFAERKQTEEALKRERRLFVGGPVVVFRWVNAEGWPVEYASPNLESFIGYSAEDLMNGVVPYANLVYPDDLMHVAEEVAGYTKEGRTSFEQEYRMVKANGDVIWIYDFTSIIRNDRGEVTHYDGYIMDITERQQTQTNLRTIFNSVYDAVFIHGVDGSILDVNDKLLELYGVTREQAPTFSIAEDYSSPENPLDELPVTWQKVLAGEPQYFEWKARRPNDGTTFDAEVFLRKITMGDKDVVMANIRDVSDRKQAEAERVRFTERLAVAADIATQVNTILDPDELLETVIPLIKERFGLYYVHVYTVDEAEGVLKLRAGYGEPGRIMVERGHHIPLDAEKSLVARAARTQEMVLVDDVREDPEFLSNPLLPDTKSEVAVPAIAGGKVLGVFDVQHDVAGYFTEADLDVFRTLAEQIATAFQNAQLFAERKHAEEAAAQERNFANAVIDSLPGIFFMHDTNGKLVRCNKAYQEAFGFPDADLENVYALERFPEEERGA
ncbi:MAG: PAS domain S-box protein, partial [Anaerolineae bacterium]|nr:PAS domain S-box protein [Anaerolineae bacterium]